MKESSYAESVTVVEKDADHTSAVKTTLTFEANGDVLIDKEQDMEPVLAHVRQLREENDAKGARWGEGRVVGHIPALWYGPISQIKNRAERDAAIMNFFRTRPDLVAFDPYLKRH